MIEEYLYDNPNTAMDNYYANTYRNLPTLASVFTVMIFSALFYMIIAWGYPFDWVMENGEEKVFNPPVEDKLYPCDKEQEGEQEVAGAMASRPVLLNVNSVYHVYPDGTQAVKNMSFQVREGYALHADMKDWNCDYSLLLYFKVPVL